MNSSIYRFTLDMHKALSQISIPVMQGDTSIVWYITLSDGSNPYFIKDGCLAKITIKRPTGTYLVEFCAVERNTTIVYRFDQDENTAAVEGIHECDITLYGLDGRQIASPRFTMVVSERVINSYDIDLTDESFTDVDAMLKKEAERQEAETARVTAETNRAEAETARERAETARVEAENTRVANDARREEIVKDAATKEYVDDTLKVANNLFANALKGYKKGSIVALQDVSPVEHSIDCKVSIKPIVVDGSNPEYADVYEMFSRRTEGETSNPLLFSGIPTGTKLKFVVTNPNIPHYLYIEGDSYGEDYEQIYDWQPISFNGNCYEFTAPSGYFAIAYDNWYDQREVSSEITLYGGTGVVKVLKAGRNLFRPFDAESTKNGFTVRLTKDGFFETSGTFDSSEMKLYVPSDHERDVFPPGVYQTIGAYNGISATRDVDIMYQARYTNGDFAKNISWQPTTITKPFYIYAIAFYAKNSSAIGIKYPAVFGVSTSNTFSDYEAFKEIQTYDVNDDGTVEGLRSYSPSMTLLANTEGATLDVTYNRDINKAFAELTNAIISTGGNV